MLNGILDLEIRVSSVSVTRPLVVPRLTSRLSRVNVGLRAQLLESAVLAAVSFCLETSALSPKTEKRSVSAMRAHAREPL